MNQSLHILHVMTGIDRGGAENHLFDLVSGQLAAGHTVEVAYLKGGGYWAAALRRSGAAVHALGLGFYGDPRPVLRLRQMIARDGFDLIHAHLPPAELYARLALQGISPSTLPLVISKHNDCPFHPSLPGEKALGRWVARRASAVIAISDAVRRYMVGVAGLEEEQVETIFYGLDVRPFDCALPEKSATLRRGWGADDATLLVGFVGRFVEQKSIDTLIRAFAIFCRKEPRDAKLVIVGAGPLESALRRAAEASGVAERVVWAGFHEDIVDVMHAFDVFALTSRHEGFGLVLVEAMAARRPVVATRTGAIGEVVVNGETGFLAEPGDAASVADALAKLTDASVRARLGAAGHRRVGEHFTLERMWDATEAVYARSLAPTFHSTRRAPQPATASF